MKALVSITAAAGVLLSAAAVLAGDNPPSGPKLSDELQKLRAGLSAPHQTLLDRTMDKAQANQAAAKLNKGGFKPGDSPTKEEAGKLAAGDLGRYDSKEPAKGPVDIQKQKNDKDPYPDDKLKDAPNSKRDYSVPPPPRQKSKE